MGCLSDLYDDYQSPIFVLIRVPEEDVSRYGVVAVKEKDLEKNIYRIIEFIEKPKLDEAPSNLIFVGGGVMTHEIIDQLLKLRNNDREIKDGLPITDAFVSYLKEQGVIYGWEFLGKRLDCGTLEGLEVAEKYLRNI